MKGVTHIDCFAGPGGICTGFKAAGIKTVLAIEKVDSVATTYLANHPEVPLIKKDIRKVTLSDIKKHVKAEVDIVTAGMPCETFSTAGATSRSSYDHRQYLFSEGIRIAKAVNAKLILFENVPGIASKRISKESDRLIVDEIYDELSKNGYKFNIQTTLSATDFGVPQFRKRFFLLATKDKGLELKVPIACHNGKITVDEAINDLPPLDANDEEEGIEYISEGSEYAKLMRNHLFWNLDPQQAITYHLAPRHRPKTLERFKLIEQGEGLKNLFFKYTQNKVKRLQSQGILPKKFYIQRNRRLIANAPSVTVTSHCLDELLHPTLNRSLTVREVARLQGFPDSYDFKGGPYICPHMYEMQDKYEQVGDAVPPLLANAWGKVIREILGK